MIQTRIFLTDCTNILVARPLQEIQKAFYKALEGGGWLLITGDNGEQVSINPDHVLYLKEIR